MNNTEPLVLAVDDEPGILRLMKVELETHGFKVITAKTGNEAILLYEERRPDVVLLDIRMPSMDGHETFRRLREYADVPIIFVTARDSDAEKIRGLELGADDYVVKPFNPDELAARIDAVLRRVVAAQAPGRVVELAGGIVVDLERRLVTRRGEQVDLTRTEWMLLQHMAANPGKVMLGAELLTKVWGPEYRDDLQYLRVWISRLRRKLEPDPTEPTIIRTYPGIGYLLQAVEPDAASDTPEGQKLP